MGQYEVRFLPSVRKDLRRIPMATVRRLLRAIDALTEDPRPPGCVRLSGTDLYRVRVGASRVLYEIRYAAVVVIVVKIGHRREVYR